MNKELEYYLEQKIDDYQIKQQNQHDKTMEKLERFREQFNKEVKE